MPLNYTIEVVQNRIHCAISGKFTPEEGTRIFQLTLEACKLNGLKHAFIDVSGIKHSYMATEKLIIAQKLIDLFSQYSAKMPETPRIAIFGVAPFVEEYRPASEYFQVHEIPIRVFNSLSAATGWLAAET